MKFTAAQIAGILEGEVIGNPDAVVFKLAKIEEGTEGSLTFLANPKYVNFIYTTQATITIVNNDFVPENELATTLIKVEDAYQSFSKLLEYYNQVKLMKSGIEQPSVISENVTYGEQLYLGSFSYVGKNVTIGNNVKIYPNCFIGDNVSIGDNCIFFAGVKIYSETEIGNNCNFHSGSVVGSDGFGFAPVNGKYVKIPQVGNVVLEDWVEIGSNCSIDRATMGSTVIKTGTKLDNLVQIAHNVEVGEHTVIAAQTGISGSTKIGGYSQFGGQVGVAGHLTIAPNTSVGGQAGITGNVTEENQKLTGTPATDVRTFLKSVANNRKLGTLMQELESLKRELESFKKP